MNVRIISGIYGGRKIEAPTSSRTHPMGERVRSALFNIIKDDLPDAEVLDVFAGTGSVGLEALSRGALHATFVEKDRVASSVLMRNIETLSCQTDATVVTVPVATWLKTRDESKRYDIVFADPPYDDLQLSTVTKLFGLLKPGGLMILSHPGRGEAPTEMGVVVVDNRSYGTATLTFYRREE